MRLNRTLFCVFLGLAVGETASAAEVPFSPQTSISSGLNSPIDARITDLDGDGDLDVVFSSRDSNLVGWLEQTGSGFTQRSIESLSSPTGAVAADLDGDGDLDVAATSDSQNRVRWYENDGSSPPGWTGRDVSTSAEGAQEVFAADVNRDGDLDLVSVGKDDDEVAWFESDGASPPGFTRRVINEDPDASGSGAEGYVNGPTGVLVFDPDRDGDSDVAVLGLSVLAWFENANGLGTSWSPHTAASGLATGTELASADLDRDGDPDLAAAVRNDDAVYWYENDGTPAVGAWTQRTALSGVDFGTGGNVAVGDVDGDGDIDVVSSSAVDAKLYWADSDGASPPAFTAREIAGQAPIAHTGVADVDGDGDADLLARDSSGNQLRWLRNDTIHRSAAFGTSNTIDSAVDFPSWISAADLDRDGDQDAMIINVPNSPAAGIRWRENTDGAGSFGPAQLIASAFVARVIRVGDLDRDGDPDLVTASTFTQPRLAWHENTAGDASAWTTHAISTTYPSPYHADIGDIDRDGDLDVIASSSLDGNGSLAWFENTAGDASAWTQRAVSPTPNFPTDVRLADVDGDGDLDAFYCAAGFFTTAWMENTAGDGSAWSEHTIEDGLTNGPSAVEPADVDRDGDVDVVMASRGSNNSAWFENANGAGTSWTRHLLGSPARLSWLRASDLDRDGDVDVVGSGELEDRLYVFRNLSGDGASWDATGTAQWVNQPLGLDAADLDGDGDDDLLAVGFESDNVISVMNGGGQFALTTRGKDYQGMVDGRKLDVLTIDAWHRGRAGDSDAEIADFELRFEDEFGAPLSSAQANALLSQVRFYLDNGNRTFEDGVDTPLLTQGPLTLTAGVAHFTPADGDANHQLAAATARLYHVVATLQATASSASPKRFQVVHLTESSSQAEDRSNDLPLSLEGFPDTGSEVIEALPTAGDADADGLSNLAEADTYGSDPLDVDTDKDQLEDDDEVNTHLTSPIDNDSEDDGLGDGVELNVYGTNPLDWDSDDDNYCDGPFPIFGCAAGDNCPAIENEDQTNSDSASAGDLCQCGNVDGAGGITSADYNLARAAVVKPTGPPFDADFCDVNGDAACDVEDLAVLQRIVGAQSASVQDACPGYRGQ